ncbi:LLM class F420-dependent oxidoreductase (plasmid) [Mycolicibacterium arabiense]|uniref:LLM class F420-dependent oxidoreductase n=1 Tax=Mycolicibacterium arabiense TaxID=1286181 RepID=A0A7I7RRD3_9MYCO|nr:LLM class F420-dependent oxidoreductase [Mycolicibacterium arabiense]MCV7376959.1 LLM class F420-dependent oxidoreductase [Mycolicibacterium arabiense]BBY46770.1 LLM class F420-dependent oxidoreductase [Mycolicibacterium arabiense]
MTIRLGLQIPNFSYGRGVGELFPSVIGQAREAESAGFDALFLMDHLYQLPQVGAPEDPMLECYTALAVLASVTERIQLGTMVTGNTYRNPTMLAKIITTLDVVSAGRAILGLGAGWYELEHIQLGYEFGTFTERFERLEEALSIIAPMLRGERPTVAGKWYRTENALAAPRFRDDIPILLGGGGEKKTFRLAARYASHLNVFAPLDQLKAKLDVLSRRCEEVGRDPATLETSALVGVHLDGVGEPAAIPAGMEGLMITGTADQIAERLRTGVLDVGITSIVIHAANQGHLPGVITSLGEALGAVINT